MSVKRYNGSTWDTYAGATNLSATQSQWKKTAAGGETTLSGSDDSLITLAYTVGQEAVYVNGVLMVRGSDYTATDGSSVVLTSPLVANNVVQVISAVAYAVANVIPGTTITTKGDLVTGSAIGTPTRLPIGTNNSFLVADSTQATGIRWSTNGGTFTTWRKAAAGGETTLTGTDDFALTLAYTAGQEMVYINGVLLERGVDYTASNGTSVTGLTALVAGDVATVVTIGTFAIPDAITKSTVTAKGDLLAASGSGTVTNLAVGADGTTLVADSSTSTGLRYQAPYAQQPILNSAMQVWQRGTTSADSVGSPYTADRWQLGRSSIAGATTTRQVTGDTTNLPNIQYCARVQRNPGNATAYTIYFAQTLETINSIPFTAKTVTVSFYARKGANYSEASSYVNANLSYGTGTDQSVIATGLTGQTTVISTNATLTTTWQRFTMTGTVSSTSTQLALYFSYTPAAVAAGAADYFEITGVQLELGSVATPFHTYAGTIQGELAACKRYFEKSFQLNDAPANGTTALVNTSGAFVGVSMNNAYSTYVPFQVEKRTSSPTITLYGNSSGYWGYTASSAAFTYTSTAFSITNTGANNFSGSQVQVNNTFLVVTGHWTASAEL